MRTIGREYRKWLAEAAVAVPGSVSNSHPISVIVPVFNPPVRFLEQALDSVLGQTAQNWQLIVSDDGSSHTEVKEFLDAFTERHRQDDRIIVLRRENGGISAAMNRGVDHVTHSHFGWLDHDDLLDPRCCEYFSSALSEGDIDIVYCDEDKIDKANRHFDLYAKPDFSPELLLTQMYLCHFTVFPVEKVRSIGGFRSQMDGAQDFDVALRLLPEVSRVVHITLPLYHWRAWEQSTALTIEAKPWAQTAGARAQQDYIDTMFGGGDVQPSEIPGLNNVHPEVSDAPLISVIIPTIGTINPHTHRRYVDEAVEALTNMETECEMEFVIVTTGPLPEVPQRYAGAHSMRHVMYVAPRFNFSEAINLGRTQATGDYLFLLNDDVVAMSHRPLTRMLEVGQITGVGVVGGKLHYPDGRLQHVGIVLLPSGPTHVHIGKAAGEFGYFGQTLTPRNYSAVTAAAMLVRTEVFDAVKGFDQAFAHDFNDVDFCLRVQDVGYRVAWTPYAQFSHEEGATMVRRAPDPREQTMFAERWSHHLHSDPYYSPALQSELMRIYEAR